MPGLQRRPAPPPMGHGERSLDAVLDARDAARDDRLDARLARIERLLEVLAAQQAQQAPLADVKTAAAALGKKSPSRIRAMCASGELPAVKVGKTWMVDLQAIRPPT